MTLTLEQKVICDKRLEEHQHDTYAVDIELNPQLTLHNFVVLKGVFRPETTSGFYFARYLAHNREMYLGKSVLDLGCGSGILGIVAAFQGASAVCFSDISQVAVKNTELNVSRYGLLDKVSLDCGDLFENVPGRFDVIFFNHPFFDDKPDSLHSITRAWFDEGGKLVTAFLMEANNHLSEGGRIIMPYFPFAGKSNCPLLQGKKAGYEVIMIHQENVDDHNLQKGEFLVYSLAK